MIGLERNGVKATMLEDELHVWCDNRLVGYLWRDAQQRLGFRYETGWIESGGFALSQQLPLQQGDFSPNELSAQLFFSNLLPEAGVRTRTVTDLKIADTDFDLLREIGGECAGAISILPVELTPASEAAYQLLGTDGLAQLVLHRGQSYRFPHDGERPRLSLAGAQDKCPVLIRDNELFLPQGAAASSHILKFEIPDYPHVPAYETFLGGLARRLGLPVAPIELVFLGDRSYVVIERYDRIRLKDGNMQRLHQEDFCQALGYSYARKYEHDGGPSFSQCLELVRRVSVEPLEDSNNFLRWQIFNVLAGNSDGHAKNLSLLYHNTDQVRLAPFYDLVCTRAIERIDPSLAMSVGGERQPGNLKIAHWELLADACGIRKQYLKKLIGEMADQLPVAVDDELDAFQDQYGEYPALQRVKSVILKQLRNI
jgi:serine/threonine-protein kinase HipA